MTPADVRSVNDGAACIADSLRKFIKQCPYLPEYAKQINVNYLPGDEDFYAIEPIPGNTVERRYVNGSSVRVFPFYFESRDSYNKDVLENLKISGFFEHFSDWLEACTEAKVLPELEGKRTSWSISADTQGYLMDEQNGIGSYVIQCKLRYYQAK